MQLAATKALLLVLQPTVILYIILYSTITTKFSRDVETEQLKIGHAFNKRGFPLCLYIKCIILLTV